MPPVKVREMIAVRAPGGTLAHITSLSSPGKTACGKSCAGWIVVPIARESMRRRHDPCPHCNAKIFFKVKSRGSR